MKVCYLTLYPRKNVDLANNKDIKNLVFLIGEQLLPQWCLKNLGDFDKLNKMHNLISLMAYKSQQGYNANEVSR